MEEPFIGVECAICHEEAFQLKKRKVKMEVDCCPRCARRIDAEQEEQTDSEMLKGLSKIERKEAMKERSREWARSWHGKHVRVTYTVKDGYSKVLKGNCHIKGTAYIACKEEIGWGRVKVVLDEVEFNRVTFKESETKYYGDADVTKFLIPIIDGYDWGLGRKIVSHGYERELEKPLCFYINWGERREMDIEEWGPEAQLLEAKQIEKEQEREALEGIEWLLKYTQ